MAEGGPMSAVQRFGLSEHPQRRTLADEVHARPFERLPSPVRVTHLALATGERPPGADHEHIASLCRRFALAPPPEETIHFSAEFGSFRLRWERHTEFSTYTFFRFDEPPADPFAATALELAPPDWLAGLPGEVLAAVHLSVEKTQGIDPMATFAPGSAVGSLMVGGDAEAYTDFTLRSDGFSRIIVGDRGMTAGQNGRLVQRLLEIETYRIMALLAFPVARAIGPELTRLDQTLADIISAIAGPAGDAEDRALLERLIALAARAEHLSAAHGYRFSAARAYHDLVRERIRELREQKLPGLQTVEGFMDRRFGPAMSTCQSVAKRLSQLSARIARASDLLRTRVDIALEERNRDLLASMNRRARLQLRLQQTVEGLSVVAISYYGVGLIGYAARGAKTLGLRLDDNLVEAVALPAVVAAAAFGLRHMRRVLAQR